MTVTDSLANGTRAAHDVGLAAWLGGAMFGKFAHNPSLANIASHTERGTVSNAAWNGYNAINAAGLGAAAIGWTAARFSETRPANLSGDRAGALIGQGRPDGRSGPDRCRQRRAGRAPGPAGARWRGAGRDGHQAGSGDAREGRAHPAQPRRPGLGQHRRRRRAGRRQRGPRAGQPQPPGQEARAVALVFARRSNSPLWIGTAVTTAAAALDQTRRRRA